MDKTYCSECGTELKWQSRRDGFSTKTGKPMFKAFLQCPQFTYKGWLGKIEVNYAHDSRVGMLYLEQDDMIAFAALNMD